MSEAFKWFIPMIVLAVTMAPLSAYCEAKAGRTVMPTVVMSMIIFTIIGMVIGMEIAK